LLLLGASVGHAKAANKLAGPPGWLAFDADGGGVVATYTDVEEPGHCDPAGCGRYAYSAANKKAGLTWDEATFKVYSRNPRAKVPGTKKMFPGLASNEDIDTIWAYLGQFDPDGNRRP
jgi:hypothetical protein